MDDRVRIGVYQFYNRNFTLETFQCVHDLGRAVPDEKISSEIVQGKISRESSLAIHSVDLQGDSSGGGLLLGRRLDHWFRLDHLAVESSVFDGFNHDGGQLLRVHHDPSGVTHEVDHNIRDPIHFGQETGEGV